MAEDSRFKTMRHIETVRNFLDACIIVLISRAHDHDQSKLQSPELEMFDEHTPKLRGLTYGSKEYNDQLKQCMDEALQHHYAIHRHHPEHFKNGIRDMTLIDLLEMLVDWKAASMRHNNGNILKSIEINQTRFNYGEELKLILENTAKFLDNTYVQHHAEES